MIPYGRQSIDEGDIDAVVEVLRSDWLTTGPKGPEFEEAFRRIVGAKFAVAVSSGTAALHAAMHALGIGPGDEVIVPAMTFAASANCVVYQGGTPVFADVDHDTLLLDPASVESRITRRTRAIVAVDYAGQPCDYEALRTLSRTRGLALVGDASHALGAADQGGPVGSIADLTTFSLHPVKHITTGEGGVVTTDDPEAAARMRRFRNHGITADHRARETQVSWFYEMTDLGYNYRLTDFQCALGISQLKKLSRWIARRREIAGRYDAAFGGHPVVRPLRVRAGAFHSYHLYVIRLGAGGLGTGRDSVFRKLREAGIGVNVHYIPVHLHPFYRRRLGTAEGMCPVAESAYGEILSLPVFPRMSDEDAEAVIRAVREATEAGGRRA
jgi:perosamine synthetase